MGLTAIEKHLARASGMASVAPGDIVHPDPDLVIVHDGYIAAAHRELGGLGIDRVFDPDRVVFVTDHDVIHATPLAAERARQNRLVAENWGISRFYDVGQGGQGHVFPMEEGLVRPGMFLLCYDMHCTNFGAVGALALRTGSEIITVLAQGTIWVQVPHTIKIELTGKLAPRVMARDLGFRLAADFVSGRYGPYDYRAIEVHGPALRHLPVAERIALCNTLTEIGLCATYFAPDEQTAKWHRDRGLAPGDAIAADPDAGYESELTIDLSAIEPQAVLPGGEQTIPLRSAELGRAVDHAYLGSCGSGTFDDLVVAADILRGRTVAAGTRFLVTPGSNATIARMEREGLGNVFRAAGAILLPAGCGPCAGGTMGPLGSGETSICTAAVNNFGRMGAKDADIFLASPATVAASAVAGVISDPRPFFAERSAT
ncbi:3-isopropylmalate dehydratase large subunit [Limimaricola litoreus]|uniref:Aconitase family protein n=1 Tax=Limimaricola litoreus TaxID=2955316 RepID=A0A9X2JRN5_9RHOB|nr:aconitase family protein [Limimaricola litoreus]MCP1170625.1 aconitase family protein [Limimaricola litoreus]